MSAWTYEKAGVPHLKGDPGYNREIARIIASTRTPGMMGNVLGFAALFDLKKTGVRDPLLVSSTDGVGTKLEIARIRGRHDTIGIDLVAMCVNDLITCGARPVIFLDYFATGKFDAGAAKQILTGIASGCRDAGCALVGGETAIMPGFYSVESGEGVPQYDLAGFSVGIVARKKVIDGRAIRAGDKILGVASSGFHSNGYSLIRKVFSEKELKGPIGKLLLTPTKIYVRPVLQVISKIPVTGIANITGGGMIDNIPRVIPDGLRAVIDSKSWPQPKLFHLVKDSGNISDFEMMRTFNMGIGLVFILRKQFVAGAQKLLARMGLASWAIGEITKGKMLEIR